LEGLKPVNKMELVLRGLASSVRFPSN